MYNASRMAKWMAQEPERKKKLIEEKKKRLEKHRNEPKHHFNDSSYMDQIHSTEENIDNALQQGMQAASSAIVTGTKRSLPEQSYSTTTKKQRFW